MLWKAGLLMRNWVMMAQLWMSGFMLEALE